ncbi:uncharacterized protein LOC131144020 [Malania oleifera]|uniref:uncharacterized protein LOC131144020 n=1 Tax=Malania oleifera TaxID=397392 RepID=UPI0025AE076F|nr:uncharacterized protein LOC131144020 [Malania oleifera]
MGRLWIGMVLQWSELLVSTAIYVAYGLYIVSTALSLRLSNALLNEYYHLFNKPNKASVEEEEEVNSEAEAYGSSCVDDEGLPPVVMVHGLFGFGKGRMGGLSYFGGAENMERRVLVPDLGAFSSMHDRARELFYYLKGGQVDYGEEHSKAAGHSQFGRVYVQGHYPEWDEDHPVHFVGHSAGAQVIRVLQQMLADKAFKGYEDTSENWVLSITSISGALNGSTRAYLDGMNPEDWRNMKPTSLLRLVRIGIAILDWLDVPWIKSFYNFGFDHYNITWRKTGVSGLIDYLLGNIGPCASGDWILPDLTIQGAMQINTRLNTFPNTFYFSYATKQTRKFMGLTIPSNLPKIHPLLWFKTLQMSQWCYPPEVEPPYEDYWDEDWQDNDGALNTKSMTHPRLPIEHPSRCVVEDEECQPMKPGIWYYKTLEADHMFFVLNRERAGVQFDLMYDDIFERCRKHIFRNGVPNCSRFENSALVEECPTPLDWLTFEPKGVRTPDLHRFNVDAMPVHSRHTVITSVKAAEEAVLIKHNAIDNGCIEYSSAASARRRQSLLPPLFFQIHVHNQWSSSKLEARAGSARSHGVGNLTLFSLN